MNHVSIRLGRGRLTHFPVSFYGSLDAIDLCCEAVRHGMVSGCYRIKGETSANRDSDRYRYRKQALKGEAPYQGGKTWVVVGV